LSYLKVEIDQGEFDEGEEKSGYGAGGDFSLGAELKFKG
jgi:hypothetical protein